MPFISEAASALKSRFGFHDHSSESVPPVRSTPDIFKSASRSNLLQSAVSTSAVRSTRDVDDHEVVGAGSLSQSFELCEDPSFWKDHNVQVIIRIRPLSSAEISTQGYSKCIRQENFQTVTWTGHPESRFTFDVVADEKVSQEKLFKVAGVPMVENCVGGYNSCMFAYGQTGSGKTHTMLGDIEEGTRRHSVNCGMTPRVFEYLFSRIQKEKEDRRDEKLRFTCKCSFLEIYNEQILDLLDPSSINLQIREDIKKGVHVENLKEIEVNNARDVIQQLIQGAANRKVASTNMNRASSRSHSVFTCIIESKWESQGVNHHRFARLNLVDLAGSERQKSSGAEGERLKEATNINKSLSTLGLVIMNLVNMSNGKSLHVPYRDSKLTFLLQDSLGGNSKTTIIANISPSNCCSSETLSTLKFAQRAKFIKNNAIVNEDTSGDVLAMRMQIQQLKKEVLQLRGLVNGGGEIQENDAMSVCFPGSPGAFNWEGLNGSSSPLTTDKRKSKKKDYEAALVGAFRREKDKDVTLQALVAENQAAMQLAKQREDEIQGLKMRLRFREAGIKRLEAVASGKISAETHLLKENEEHLKEIEVLRSQVDRNQEVTRFAMENLRLKEEIRRLKSFCEEGEREMMNQQIMVLQNKLLEALDWKLMHESDPSSKGNMGSMTDVPGDDNLLTSSQESVSPWRSSINEENEFLRMQAIQNQSEMESLRKKLNFCIEEKENLERQVNDFVTKLEEERPDSQKMQIELPSLSTNLDLSDQMELKTMVDAIAAASQREAEAHETAFILSKENDELRMKLKVIIEDNNKLIELYERAVAETNVRNSGGLPEKAQENDTRVEDQNNKGGVTEFSEEREMERMKVVENLEHQIVDLHEENEKLKGGVTEFSEEKEMERMKVVENLEHQLVDLHEENEKLLGLYEKAMQERDEFKRILYSNNGENRFDCPEKLVEVDGEAKHVTEETCSSGQNGSAEADDVGLMEDICYEQDETEQKLQKVPEEISLVRTKLDRAHEILLTSARTVNVFGELEKSIIQSDNLSREIEAIEDGIQIKQQELKTLKVVSSELQERRTVVNKKLSALKYSLSNFCSSVAYFEQREIRARGRVNVSSSYLNQKREELVRLEAQKVEMELGQRKFQQSEVELRKNLACLKLKLDEENQRRESEKVLFAIDNIEKAEDHPLLPRSWNKATDLLKSEEEKIKLQTELKLSREHLVDIRKDIEDLNVKLAKVEKKIEYVEVEIEKGLKTLEEMEFALEGVVREKEMVLEMRENGIAEVQNAIVEYQQFMFEAEMKEAEMGILEEELQEEVRRIEELQIARGVASEKKTQLLEGHSVFLSEKMEEELRNVRVSVLEAKSLLGDGGLIES